MSEELKLPEELKLAITGHLLNIGLLRFGLIPDPPPWPPSYEWGIAGGTSEPPDYACGADPAEVLAFRLHPGYPGDGILIHRLTDAELDLHVRAAGLWLKERPSAWLYQYGAHLLTAVYSRRNVDE